MSKLSKALIAAAGNAGESLYVEDVFSTYLYTGNSTSQTITNDIDLSGEGGLTWIKKRSAAENHYLWDTERTNDSLLFSNLSNAALTGQSSSFTFNSDGFSLPTAAYNNSGQTYASWTFRKAEKFFDVVTYTGNSTAGRTVSHNLGSVPAVIIVKKTSSASSSNWYVYHSSLGSSAHILLNTTSAADTSSSGWNSTNPTATEFTLGNNVNVNASGESFVAYLFASDAGGFGDDGSESIIKCGSFTGNGGSSEFEVTCGWEAQYVLVKNINNASSNWIIFDAMRSMSETERVQIYPNTSDAEFIGTTGQTGLIASANGFKIREASTWYNENGANHIYIAIRRPMKTPESGTEVFAVAKSDGTSVPSFNAGFPIDTALLKATTVSNGSLRSRLTGTGFLETNGTGAEGSNSFTQWDYQDSWYDDNISSSYYSWMFKRATGFFDVVAYTGDGVAGRTVAHNLGVAPQLMIVKSRSKIEDWAVYHAGISAPEENYLYLNGNFALNPNANTIKYWNHTAPTASEFTLGIESRVNGSGHTYIAYLFATLAGVSKVGSYTGTGADLNVDCGFSAGARFILIKRTDSTGDWYVWDSARGIVAGNDPYLLINSTAAEVTSTDYIDPLASGFTVTSSAPAALNASGGTYIFLAIA